MTFSRGSLKLSLAAFTVVLVFVTGCTALTSDDDERDLWSPFHSQSLWANESGAIRMDLSGYERGHDPGSRATFDVSVENRHDSEFAATVCAYLVDDSGIVLDLDRIEIQLASDNQISTSIEVEFPEDLERRAYGFAVVLEEWGAMVHTIRLGIPDDEAGPWIDLGELTCN